MSGNGPKRPPAKPTASSKPKPRPQMASGNGPKRPPSKRG